MSRFANALANANARSSPRFPPPRAQRIASRQRSYAIRCARGAWERGYPLPCSQKCQTHHSAHYLLQGTSGCAMARLMSRFAIALANANARRSPYLARRSVKPTENAGRSLVLAYVPLHYLEAVEDIYHRQVEYHRLG